MLLEQLVLAPAKVCKECFAVDGLDPAALQVVITAIEQFPSLVQLLKVPDHYIFNQFAHFASGFPCQLVQFGFEVWVEMHFHRFQGNEKLCSQARPPYSKSASTPSVNRPRLA